MNAFQAPSKSTVHPENRPRESEAPSREAGPSFAKMVAGGAACGVLGAVLGTMLMSAELAAGDTGAFLSAIPLSAAAVAIVTGLAAAMMFTPPEGGQRG